MKFVVGAWIAILVWIGWPARLEAAMMGEISVMGSYSKTNFGNNTFSTTRRYTGAAAVNLTPVTQVELSYTYTDTFFNYDPIQTTSINEQVLSLSVVQSLVPPNWIIQPYGKGGVAQYNREQSGTVAGIPSAKTSSKSPSAVLGAGLRIYLLKNFSLKIEGVTYLPDMKFEEAKNNFSFQGGFGWSF